MNIKRETKKLFELLKNETDEAKAREIKEKIFLINEPMILNELSKIRERLDQEFFENNKDEYKQNLCETLWIAINKYDPEQNATLYTFAKPFFKHAIAETTRGGLMHGLLDQYTYAITRSIISIINDADINGQLTENMLYSIIMNAKSSNGGRINERTAEMIHDFLYPQYFHKPVKRIEPVGLSPMPTIEQVENADRDEAIKNKINSLTDAEKELLYFILDNGFNLKLFAYRNYLEPTQAEQIYYTMINKFKNYALEF